MPFADTAPGLPLTAAPYKPVAPAFQPGMSIPDGYRVRYEYRTRELLAGGGILALSFTVTTLIASGIAASGFPGALFAPVGGIPVLGAYPLAALAGIDGAGPGTVGALLGFGVLQGVGFGILLHGLVARKPVGIVPVCAARREGEWTISPLAAPGSAGLSVGGVL